MSSPLRHGLSLENCVTFAYRCTEPTLFNKAFMVDWSCADIIAMPAAAVDSALSFSDTAFGSHNKLLCYLRGIHLQYALSRETLQSRCSRGKEQLDQVVCEGLCPWD